MGVHDQHVQRSCERRSKNAPGNLENPPSQVLQSHKIIQCWVTILGQEKCFSAVNHSSQRCSKIKPRDSAHAGAFAD